MKKTLLAITILILFTSSAIAQTTKKTDTPIDSLSYALGINIAHSLKGFPAKVDVQSLSKGMNDVFEEKTEMSAEESGMFLQNYFMNQQAQTASKNKEAGQAFLTANKDKPGITTSPSGLQYKIERTGTGIKPTEDDEVEVHYRGTLIDGREFDSSYDRDQTAKFPLKSVIKGWTEGLQHASEGGKIILYVPADLAYGDTAKQGSIIEGGSTLIFEIELIKVINQQ